MRSIRSGRGLGDNIYLQSIVRHFIEGGEPLEVCTDWPDLFRAYGDRVSLAPFRRTDIDIVAHYTARKGIAGTDQFKDCCLSAGITRDIEFRLDWTPVAGTAIPADGRPVVLVHLLRAPFARTDGYGLDLLPDGRRLQEAIDGLKARGACLVQVGKGPALHPLAGFDLDLVGQTTVPALLDLATRADAFLGYCSFVAPLAEALRKPALFIWSRRGLGSRTEYIRQIVPAKILRWPSSLWCVDDCSVAVLSEAVDALHHAAAGR